MSKGDTIRFEFADFADPSTGARVTRLSTPDAACARNYFYQKCFTSDGLSLLLGVERGGDMDLCLLDLASGVARRLTDAPGVNVQGAWLSPDDRYVFFTRSGLHLVKVDLATLEESVVYSVSGGWIGYGTWVANSACTKVAALEMLAADQVKGGSGWDRFARQFAARPRQRLIEISLASGSARVVLEDRRFLGHPMYRPFDDGFMGFCHEGPHDLVESRIWFVDSDGTRLRKAKEQAPGESCTHEFWVPDGSRLLYVSYMKGEATRSVWSVDPMTLRNERLMGIPPCAHLMSDFDGSLLVGDGAGHLGDVDDKEGHAFASDPRIYLFDLRRGTYRPVCEHRSSWAVYKGNTQANHPHPSFSPDGLRVFFASDFSGKPGLYMADLPAPLE